MAKKTTIEDLAVMVKKGFDNTPTKSEFEALDGKVELLRIDMKDGFSEVKRRFDRIENIILAKHEHRIEMLEERIKEISSALSI
jgi:hypothetical protein